MNKTVNINLAGIFFHIDEDAYLKLQHYLEAIKYSFTDSQGRDEIIDDIEARIAEIFNERIKNDRQVISIQEVDDVIAIMGQPEDYLVDEEIFEDEPQKSNYKTYKAKKLFRDQDNSYVSGVSSGLAHYFGIDAIWIRLAWMLLIFGAGVGIFLYILLWVLVPEAKTTSEKLTMTGEPVNINNIEKKIKDGFVTVTETVTDVAKNVSDSVSNATKNGHFKKQANSIKSSSKNFFDTLGNLFMVVFNIFAKFIGVLLIFIGASTLIALIIGLLSFGVVNIIHIPGIDMFEVVNATQVPQWLISLLVLFAIGVPFFFLFYLGLKTLINNLKSIGNVAKFSLLGIWLTAIIGLSIIALRQASEHAFNDSVIEKKELYVSTKDTLNIEMVGNALYSKNKYGHRNDYKIITNSNESKIIYRSAVRVVVKSTSDSVAKIIIKKSADGNSYDKARERAKDIQYLYAFTNNTLLLDSYLTTNAKNKLSNQEVLITLFLPEGTIANFNQNTKHYLNYYSNQGNMLPRKYTNYFVKILNNKIRCLNCPENNLKNNINSEKVKIDNTGIEINNEGNNIKIDKKGIKVESENVKVNIDPKGVNIKSEN